MKVFWISRYREFFVT